MNSYINTEVVEKNTVESKENGFFINHSFNDIKVVVDWQLTSTSNGIIANVSDVLRFISSNTSLKDIPSKDKLPVAYFSVSNFVGGKKDYNATAHSGLVVIDIDVKDNPDVDFHYLKQQFSNDKYCFACFTSPSGGLKVIFNTSIKDLTHHKAYYAAIKDYILQHYLQIKEIDTSGSNMARACFLPFDKELFFNPQAIKFELSTEEIEELLKKHPFKKSVNNINFSIEDLELLSLDEHIDNLINLLMRTEIGVGIEAVDEDIQNRTEIGIGDNGNDNDSKNRTRVGIDNCILSSNNRTRVGIDNPTSNTQNRTEVGIYANIFSSIRYTIIKKERIVMSTFVRFLELLVLEHHNPHRLDYTTRIDESYFADNPDKKITSFEIEGFDGLEYCSVKLPEQIKEGYRGKTLASITMKLIYNNPFCHPYLLFKEVKRINDLYSEDPNPKNPKPDDEEVFKIVMFNYQRFLAGELNFEKVLEKNNKNQIAKKHVFRSKHAKKQGKAINHIEGIKAYHNARTNHIFNKYLQAIKDLQDGCKITQKRIGVYMGMDERTIRRYQTPETKAMIKDYNDFLKKERACKSKPTPENEVEGYEPEAKIALSRPEEIQPSVNCQSPIPETNYETTPNQNTEPDIDFSVIEFVNDIIQPIEEPNEVDLEEVFKNIFEGFIKRNAGNDVEELRRLFKKHFDALGQNEKQLLLIPYESIKDLTTSCKQANVENKLRNEVLEIYLDVVQ